MKVVLVDSIAKETAQAIRAYLEKTKLPFPAYRDEARALADRLAVPVTPYYYLIDKDSVVRYAGSFESGTPGQKNHAPHLANAVEDVLAGRPVRVKSSTQVG